MNSFCELPRTAPVATVVEKLNVAPVVPEVSIMFDNNYAKKKSSTDNMYLSYNAWKSHNPIKSDNATKPSSADCVQRQVRFNSPTVEQNETKNDRQVTTDSAQIPQNVNKPNVPFRKPFEQIYMANMPSRQLDLSMVETENPLRPSKENIHPTNNYYDFQRKTDDRLVSKPISPTLKDQYKSTKSSCENDIEEKHRIIDLYNYNRNNFNYLHRQTLDNSKVSNNTTPLHKCNCESSTTKVCDKKIDTQENKSEEPTVKDLLKIIQQQNEQLLILQKQVATLINNKDATPQIEAPPLHQNNNIFDKQYQTSTQLETQEGLYNRSKPFLAKKGPFRQFSLDVMTSFEVSIRQQNLNRGRADAINHPPKICEITESDNDTNRGNDSLRNNYISMTFNEPVQITERCPTPVNSIKIDMKDYSSDEEEDSTSQPGWTFYNNVLGQVNHILKKSGIPTKVPSANLKDIPKDPNKQKLMEKVKEATIKHLQSIGVHVPAAENDDSIQSNSLDNTQNEVSFAVKQLLMKYLPDDQLAKIMHKNRTEAPPVEPVGPIKRRPEFSFATVQYMQKYKLLNDSSNNLKPNQQQIRHAQQPDDFDRILDITAIKQQPKLL